MKKRLSLFIALFAIFCLNLCGFAAFAIAAPGDTNLEGWVQAADGYYYDPDPVITNLFDVNENDDFLWGEFYVYWRKGTVGGSYNGSSYSFSPTSAVLYSGDTIAVGEGIGAYSSGTAYFCWGNTTGVSKFKDWDFNFKMDFGSGISTGTFTYRSEGQIVVFDFDNNKIDTTVWLTPYTNCTYETANQTSTTVSHNFDLRALTGVHYVSILIAERTATDSSAITRDGNNGGNIIVTIDDSEVSSAFTKFGYYQGHVAFENRTNKGIALYTAYDKVTFDSNGGSAVDPVYVKNVDHKISAPAAPTRAGYNFDYWYYDNASVAFDFNTAITQDITLTAHWTQVNVVRTVTFVSAYGTITPIEVIDGGTLGDSLPTAADGGACTFVGWYTTANYASGTEFTSSTPVNADITVYAKYNAPASPNGEGWVLDETDGYFYEDNPAIIDWFDVEDGTFSWKKYTLTNIDRTQSNCSQPAEFGRTNSTLETYKGVFLYYNAGNEVVYNGDYGNTEANRRHWDFKFKLDFTGITSGSIIYYFDAVKIVIDFTANTITMTDEQWYGWKNDHHGPFQTVAFDSAAVTSAFGSTLAALTGEHTVTLLMEDRVISSTSEISGANKGLRVTVGIDANSVVGTFGSAMHYYAGMFGLCNYTNAELEIYSTLYNKVRFVSDGGNLATSVIYVESANHKISAPANPERLGYRFDYWYLNDENTAFNFNTAITQDITLTAHWTEIGAVRTVTFVATYDTLDPVLITDGESLGNKLSNAESIGAYIFAGWYTTANYASGTEFTSSTPVTADITVYAKYIKPASPNGEGWVFNETDGYFYEPNPDTRDIFDVIDGTYSLKRFGVDNIDRTVSSLSEINNFTRDSNVLDPNQAVFLYYGRECVWGGNGLAESNRRHWDFDFKIDFSDINSGALVYYYDCIKVVVDFDANTITVTNEYWHGWQAAHAGPFNTFTIDSDTINSTFGSALSALTGNHTFSFLMEDRVISSRQEITSGNHGLRITVGLDNHKFKTTFGQVSYAAGLYGFENFTNTAISILSTSLYLDYNVENIGGATLEKKSASTAEGAYGKASSVPQLVGYTVKNWYNNTDCDAVLVFEFDGWYFTAQLSGDPVTADTVIPESTSTLYAKWKLKEYTLSFGGLNGVSVKVNYGSALGDLPAVPERTGYNAIGWKLDNKIISSSTKWTYDSDRTANPSYKELVDENEKQALIEELRNYANQSDYSSQNWANVQDTVNYYIELINEEDSMAGIRALVASAKTDIDSIAKIGSEEPSSEPEKPDDKEPEPEKSGCGSSIEGDTFVVVFAAVALLIAVSRSFRKKRD